VAGLKLNNDYELIVVGRQQLDNKVIVSRVVAYYGNVEWTYVLDFKYSEAPMLIDYKWFNQHGHHSLATKDSADGFAIARLKIKE
jgi:hypothetical protein